MTEGRPMHRVPKSYVLQPGDRIVFVRRHGRKGAGEARTVFDGSDGTATRLFCTKLERSGLLGRIAAQLFRVQKASSRAKKYRGGIQRSDGTRQSYSDLAYERKDACIERLCDLLEANFCGLNWGWKEDPKESFAKNVLYVELPTGQVSFHAITRHAGPDFEGDWDGTDLSVKRIVEFCQSVFEGTILDQVDPATDE